MTHKSITFSRSNKFRLSEKRLRPQKKANEAVSIPSPQKENESR